LNDLCQPKNITVVVDPDAREWLLEHGFDAQMGARPLNRCIDTHIKRPMSKEILFGKLTQGGRVLVTLDSSSKKLKLDFLGLNNTTSGFNVLQDTLLDVEMES
jgi:ATP-dependent Clp protease ATP-binding subunit ClpA